MDLEQALRQRVQAGQLTVPPAPTACLQLSHLLSERDWSMAELDRVVRSDPAVTGSLLRMANSVALRGREPITTIPAAVTRLGARGVLKLAWASSTTASLTPPGPLLRLRQRAWREALVAAQVSQWLASPRLQLSPHDPETSFVMGMLHDIGKLVVLGALEDLLRQQPDARVNDAWELIESLHLSAGALLVDAWKLPAVLGQAITEHHELGETEWLQTVDAVVAQVEAVPHVTAVALGHIGALDTNACLELAERLPELVDAIRLMDPTLERAESSPFEVDGIAVSTGDRVFHGSLLSADARSLHLVVEADLPPRMLVRVHVGALQFHARVEWASDGQFRLYPWALDPARAQAFAAWSQSLLQAA